MQAELFSRLPDRAGARRVGIIAGMVLGIVFGLLLPWARGRPLPRWPWGIGGVLIVTALVAPNILRGMLALWMRVAQRLSRLLTLAIAAATFVLVITPAGWVMRSMGHDPMTRRFDPDAPSYRVPSRKPDASSMERPF